MKYLIFSLILLLSIKIFPQDNAQDTLFVKPYSVIIIQPTQQEIDSLTKADTAQEFVEVISDFSYYTSSFVKYLQDKKIQFEVSDANNFVLKFKDQNIYLLRRKKLTELFGYIFINSKGEFNIEGGVDTYDGLIQEVNDLLLNTKQH